MDLLKTIIDENYSKILNEDDSQNNSLIKLKFSPNLAAEFTNTLNEFTAISARMVKIKYVNKHMADKFNELYTKIKNLVDAARISSNNIN